MTKFKINRLITLNQIHKITTSPTRLLHKHHTESNQLNLSPNFLNHTPSLTQKVPPKHKHQPKILLNWSTQSLPPYSTYYPFSFHLSCYLQFWHQSSYESGIFKANQEYINLRTYVTKSPLDHVLVLKDPNWKMDMNDEYIALIQNKTWDLVHSTRCQCYSIYLDF